MIEKPAARGQDERVRRSREKVLEATRELLTETGLGGLSVDEVARRSGVAKTTIYRHWPTRSDLVLEACTHLGAEHQTPDTGSLAGDLEASLSGLAAMLGSARWTTVMPSIIDAAERDPALAALHAGIQAGHAAPFHAIIARAVGRGELPTSTDASAAVAGLVGPLYYRRWFSREPLDEAFVLGVIKAVIGSLRAG